MKHLIIVSVLLVSLMFFFTYAIHSDEESMESHVGETVIMQNDTSIITSYSIWTEEYYLNNGNSIHKSLIENK